jgi:glycosidase
MTPQGTACVALLALALVSPGRTLAAQEVHRIEPPSWWVEKDEQSLMLLVEGDKLETAEVRTARGPVRVSRVEPGREGRVVFVELVIPGGCEPGRCRLEIRAAGRTIERDWDLLARPARRPEPIGPDDVIYLAMVDRFANGDPANDTAGRGEPMLDRQDTHAYHGGDFAGLRDRLPDLADLGITAIWLTPIYRPAFAWFAARLGDSPRRMAHFHGYCPVDFYDTNPRFGSRREYQALVERAHELGLKMIQDQILGYTGPEHHWVARPPSADWIHGPIDRPPHCNFRFDALTNPHAREADRRGLTDGWFFGILPDLNMRNPRAGRYAIQQSLWWITFFGADGVRLDTYPMVDRAFWRDWSEQVKRVHPGFRAVGEAWVTDAADLSFFQGGRAGWDGIDPGVDAVFDFPLYQAATAVFSGQAPASALSQAIRRDGLYPNPELLVTFLDNHDTPRLADVAGVTPARLRLAVAFLLTMRGIPQITWGDELGLPGHMNDRRDLPGGFPDDPRDAFTPGGRTATEQQIFTTYRDLLQLRKATPALRRGSLTELVADETVYAYLRQDADERVLVALNLGKTPAERSISAGLSGPIELLYGDARWSSSTAGAQLVLPAESVAVLRLARP